MLDADATTVRTYPARRPKAPHRVVIDQLVACRRTVNWLADRCGVGLVDMACVVSGEAMLTADLAARIADAFGDERDAWLAVVAAWNADADIL
jgi:plasmid maintenance system antidote protein VapI